MYAVGHLALGYLSGKLASKILKVNVNVPLLFVASVISDVDILISGLEHRGPTHSLAVFLLLFLPALILYGRRVAPYFIALAQHATIGDYLTGGAQLFWPLTPNWYGSGTAITSLSNILTEWILFLFSITILFQTRDARILLQKHRSNLLLSIPVFTVLLPTLLGFPLSVPLELVIPHLVYLMLFNLSILTDFRRSREETQRLKKESSNCQENYSTGFSRGP